MEKSKSLEEWKQLASELKKTRNSFFENIGPNLRGIPKTVYNEEYRRMLKYFDRFKSKLEDRFSEEYPDEFDTHIFYGD